MSHDNKQVTLARSAIDRCCHVCAFFHLTETGVDAFAAERDGQFEVRPWENAYLTDGRFDQHAMIALVEDIAKDG
jgi:hypothetical protein